VLNPADGLRPEPDQAREWLSRELAHADYHRQSLVERIRDWLFDLCDELTTRASGASPLSTFAALVVAVAVIGLLVYLLPRVRRDPVAADRREVLADPDATATQLRARAEEALRDGRDEDAVGDAYRALAKRMVERGTIEQTVGSTAHELAERMVQRFPGHAELLVEAADLFDAVVYGGHTASRRDAELVLALDDELQRVRPVDDAGLPRRALAVPR
jgi:hypothetical protein